MSSRLVFVGEANPHGPPEMALYHLPRRAAGDRLRMILGLNDAQYSRLEKVNLCDGVWYGARAAAVAAEILRDGARVVALGAKVRSAFSGPAPFQVESRGTLGAILGLPHPSGRCLVWNDPTAAARAREALRVFAPEIPWGGR